MKTIQSNMWNKFIKIYEREVGGQVVSRISEKRGGDTDGMISG